MEAAAAERELDDLARTAPRRIDGPLRRCVDPHIGTTVRPRA